RFDGVVRCWAWSALLGLHVPRLSTSRLDDAMRAGTCRLQVAPAHYILSARNWQHGHDLDAVARENRKVRMIVEQLGGGLMRIRAHDRESTHAVARIVDAALRDLLGFSQRSAHADDGGMMFLYPRLPCRDAFSLLRTAIAFGKGVPGQASRTGSAAKKHGEIGIVRAHAFSFISRFARWDNNSI